jgi:hypothetical protein
VELRTYASPDDLQDYTGGPEWAEVPGSAEDRRVRALIRRASSDVDALLLTARYATDTDGYPLEESVSDALRDATCAIVEEFEENGGVNAAGFASGSLLSASFSRADTSTPAGAANSRSGRTEALRILRNAGLIRVGVSG